MQRAHRQFFDADNGDLAVRTISSDAITKQFSVHLFQYFDINEGRMSNNGLQFIEMSVIVLFICS